MYGYTYPKKMFLLGYFGTFYLLLQNMVFPNLKHFVKSVQIRTEYRKIRTRNNSVL